MIAVRRLLLLAALLPALLIGLCSGSAVATGPVSTEDSMSYGYGYDLPSAATTPILDSRTPALVSGSPPASVHRASTSSNSLRRATKAGPEPRGGVYTLRDEAGGVARTGRSNDLARRRGEHARDPELGRYEFRPEFRTDDYRAQRGLEQLLHDQFVPPLNKINPVSPRNPRRGGYIRSAEDFLGGGR